MKFITRLLTAGSLGLLFSASAHAIVWDTLNPNLQNPGHVSAYPPVHALNDVLPDEIDTPDIKRRWVSSNDSFILDLSDSFELPFRERQ